MTACAQTVIRAAIAKAIAPRKPLTVSQWADGNRIMSNKVSPKPGRWRTDTNPVFREIMDALSRNSGVQEVVVMCPIQIGKSELLVNWIGYTMCHDPAAMMIGLPGEVALNKFEQKLNPTIAETPTMLEALTSTASRDSRNQRHFKDFAGGQLMLEHAGSPQRLKSSSVQKLGIDEIDEFANNLNDAGDPLALLRGRTTAFPSKKQILYTGTPTIAGLSKIAELYQQSDQRQYHVPCPHCGTYQPLIWSGLQFGDVGMVPHYACHDCGARIDEHHKTDMIARGRWLAKFPKRKVRGYHLNALYYPLGMGLRWADLVDEWKAGSDDLAKRQVFINDRLAECWQDPAMSGVVAEQISDRVELGWSIRHAPKDALVLTAGVDTQDDRLAVHIVGWGKSMTAHIIDYVELSGNPAEPHVWVALTELLNKPIQHAGGGVTRVEATCIDAGGHRTEAVKHYCRQRMVRRVLPIFGAKPNNAPVLNKGSLQDVKWNGKTDKKGIKVHHVGTVGIKHMLYSKLGADKDKPANERQIRFPEGLPDGYFRGLTAETYNPKRNRFECKSGRRNEVLDCWVYAYAATHHPELRLHRYSEADWQRRHDQLNQPKEAEPKETTTHPNPALTAPDTKVRNKTTRRPNKGGFVKKW